MTDAAKPTARDLVDAAVAGDVPRVRALLAQGVETHISKQDVSDHTLPQQSQKIDQATADAFTLISLHSSNDRLNAAMYLSAFHGFADVVDLFLEKTAYDPLTLKVALFGAVRSGSRPLVEKLVAAGAEVSFKESLCLRESLRRGHEEIAVVLAQTQATQSPAETAAVLSSEARVDLAWNVIDTDTDMMPALAALCKRLTDNKQPPTNPSRTALLGAVDMLLSFVEGRGDDMHKFLSISALHAALENASPVMEKIALHPQMAALKPEARVGLLDFMLHQTAQNMKAGASTPAYGEHEELAQMFLSQGASPQKALMDGIHVANAALVTAALRHHADPRRDGYAGLKSAEAQAEQQPFLSAKSILTDVQLTVAALTVLDDTHYKTCRAAGDTLESLRSICPKTGRSGFLAGVAAGHTDAVFETLRQNIADIRADDILHPTAQGDSVFATLAGQGQAARLFDATLWRGQEPRYQAFWQALPDSAQTTHQSAHQAITGDFQVAARQAALKAAALAQRSKFKL